MLWSVPAAFWLATILGVIFVLHGIRLFRRRMPTTTLHIWRQVAKESHTSLRLERIVRNLPLLLQLLLAALLVLALAQPLWFRDVAFDKDVVLVVDASASMNARTGNGTRFELAQERALELVNELSDGQRMALVAMERGPRLVHPFSDDTAQLRQAIRGLRPTHAAADLKQSLLFAVSLAKDLEQRQVVLIGDGAYYENEGAAAILNNTVTFIPVTGGEDNLAIVQFAYRANVAPLEGGELLVTVESYSEESREAMLTLSLGDAEFASRTLSIEAGGHSTLIVPVPADAAGVVRAELTPEDDLAADNVAHAVIRPTPLARVLLVGPADPPLYAALQALPDIEVTFRDRLDGELQRPGRGFDLALFNRTVPPRVEQGTLAVFGALSPQGGLSQSGWVDDPRIIGWRPDDPLLRYLDPRQLQISRARRLSAERGTEILVAAVEGPLIAKRESGGVRVVTLGFDLREARFSSQDAFPLFMANLVNWARPKGGWVQERALSAGEAFLWQPGRQAAADLRVTAPDGEAWDYAVAGEPVRFEHTDLTGIYTFESGGQVERLAVNLLDSPESRIHPNPAMTGRAPGDAGGRGFGEITSEGWPWFVLAGAVFLFVEWLIWNRFS